MSAATNYTENAVLDHILGNTTYTPASTLYVGLFTAVADGETGSVTEVSGNAYARTSATFAAASSGSSSTNANVTFPAASGGNWGTITHAGIYDASTGGNLLFYGALTTSKTVTDGDTFQINSGSLTITLA